MLQKSRILLVISFFFFICPPAWAAYLDLQTSVDYSTLTTGDTFLLNIYLVGEEGDSSVSGSYAFQIDFDDSELSLHATDPLSATEDFPAGFMDIKTLTFSGNSVTGFDGFSFGSAALSAPIYYGCIEFDVLSPIADGNDDFWVTYVTGAGITIDGNIMQPASIGSDIGSAVPIPGAVLLFGSGLLPLAGIAIRKKS